VIRGIWFSTEHYAGCCRYRTPIDARDAISIEIVRMPGANVSGADVSGAVCDGQGVLSLARAFRLRL